MLTYGRYACLQVREVSQSNPATSAVNVLTVSLRSNVELLPTDGIIITIANLRGAVVSNSGGRVDVDRLPGGNGIHATPTYVSSYYCCICVLARVPRGNGLYAAITCVLLLRVRMCPHTTAIYVSSYYCYMCVLILLLYLCPSTTAICESSYYCDICVRVLLIDVCHCVSSYCYFVCELSGFVYSRVPRGNAIYVSSYSYCSNISSVLILLLCF
jgi:hypothetical protein